MRNLSLGRRHLVNAYEVEAGIGVIAGNCVIHAWAPWVWGTTKSALYKYTYLYLLPFVCNRECASADAKVWNESDPDSNSNFRINLDIVIWIRMSVEYPFQHCGYIYRRHSFRQLWFKSAVDCMRTEKTEKS